VTFFHEQKGIDLKMQIRILEFLSFYFLSSILYVGDIDIQLPVKVVSNGKPKLSVL